MKVCLAFVHLLRYLGKMILCHEKTEMIMRGFLGRTGKPDWKLVPNHKCPGKCWAQRKFPIHK
jgi:hypothetical protein